MLRHLEQKLQLSTSSDGQKFPAWYYLATDIAKEGVEEKHYVKAQGEQLSLVLVTCLNYFKFTSAWGHVYKLER